ncbi:DUF3800 domain-containing protein [Bradyrhizobium canariense]|uniref:DUF3800 domain-containing protein n=1 Tax=Bradyrhizobium canariense TaxID=255045 RepID=UPI000A18C5FA|nr:DUF3800 domain-containing protein [Bradyrhizobium canariense]OSI29581.1 hypothetical protein BST65_08340 [Bradyrhizobium canariense]OSI32851.1 hypothetical protein BST66_14850 [Bradyrhizobium canariense]OSI43650.1 hypothetical protein BSZ20_16120 [Bradyrhizobium canariense]OSI52225.1 hypothetical protein BST67_10945 [Bradyrhizobium canariense]OSI54556.1 hypothetical protein BSZ15_22145 [Bradyrhizobium canariense]
MATIFYFCDESSFHDTHMAVGGLAVNKDAIPYILDQLAKINEDYRVISEVKWENAKSRRANTHMAYIDLLFRLIQEGRAHTHIRFAPFNDYDHSLSGPKKRAATVGKMHYQLLLHRALRFYGESNELVIHPDNGDCTEELPFLVDAINNHGRAAHGFKASPVRRIECKDSKHEPLLQLLDVTLGALTAYKNDRHNDPITSATKKELAEYALAKTNLVSLERSSPLTAVKLNVWNVRPMWKKGDGLKR